MTSYTIEWLPNEGAYIGKLTPDFDVRRDIDNFSAELVGLLEKMEKPVPFIFDMTDFNMTFPDMVAAMADLTRGEIAAWRHPKLKELLIVSEQSVAKLGADALQRTQYGKIRSWFFSTLSEALEYLTLMRGARNQAST